MKKNDVMNLYSKYKLLDINQKSIMAVYTDLKKMREENEEFIETEWISDQESSSLTTISFPLVSEKIDTLYIVIRRPIVPNVIKMISKAEYSEIKEGKTLSIVGAKDSIQYFDIIKTGWRKFELAFTIKNSKSIGYVLSSRFTLDNELSRILEKGIIVRNTIINKNLD